jgi:hypothetical protein
LRFRLVCLALLFALPARGDSPRMPKQSTTWSDDRRFFVEVVPESIRRGEMSDAHDSMVTAKDNQCAKLKGPKGSAGARAKTTCLRELSQLAAQGRRSAETLVTLTEMKKGKESRRWSVEVRAYDPSVQVSNEGHVVLSGWGNEERLTILAPDGRRVAELEPNQIMSADELQGVPSSSSHLNWGEPAGFDLKNGELILSLSLEGARRPTEAPAPTVERRVSLKTGAIVGRK